MLLNRHPLAGWQLLYRYTADLMCLDFCRPARPLELGMLAVTTVTTPLSVSYWQDVLSSHPDQALARYIIGGLGNGFRIGFRRGAPLKSAQNNLQSASAHPEAVREFVTKE